MNAPITRCRYLRSNVKQQCTAEAVDPDGEILLCTKHLGRAVELLRVRGVTMVRLSTDEVHTQRLRSSGVACPACGRAASGCSWVQNPVAGPGDCCRACDHTQRVDVA